MADLLVTGSEMEQVELDGVERAFVVHNAALEALLFDRRLVGLEFTRRCSDASTFFVRHFATELQAQRPSSAELMILSKGYYYWLHPAFELVLGRNLEINQVATRRATVNGADVQVEVCYKNFDAGSPNLVIGDTLASGATVCEALREYLRSETVEEVIMFCYAGTGVGAKRVGESCSSAGIRLTMVLGLAVFGLGDNGFDLSFLHPETKTREAYRERALQLFKGRPVSAVGWDFGSQAQSGRKYRALTWVERQRWQLGDDVFLSVDRPSDWRLIQAERAAFADYNELQTPQGDRTLDDRD